MPHLVGHLAAIARFPVKSMAGEACETAALDWQGLEGDRQWAWLKAGDQSRFPWFTGRDLSALVRYVARYDDTTDPRRSAVGVVAPDGTRWRLQDAGLRTLLEERAGRPLTLIQLGRGAPDAMPVSVVSTGSLAALAAAHGGAIDPRRFRTNLLIDSDLPEEDWPGRRVRFGDGATLMLAAPAPRCAMVTIDPDTAARDPRVLRTVAQRFDAAFATYAGVARPGQVRVGDPVWVD